MRKSTDSLKKDRIAVAGLISGKKRFAPEVERWINDEILRTGKSRKQILMESVRIMMKAESARKK